MSTSTRTDRSIPLLRLIVTLLLTAATAIAAAPKREVSGESARRQPARPATASSADSVVVYGPTTIFKQNSNPTQWEASGDVFDADTTHGRRYVVELVNGPIKATGFTFGNASLSRQFVGTSEFGSSTTRLLRAIDVRSNQSNTLVFGILGPESASVCVRVVKVWDPTMVLFGRKTYLRPTPIATQADTFTIPTDAGWPYQLHALNGDTNGTAHRMTSATVSVNGGQVMSSSDFGTGRAMAIKQVTLDPEIHNTLSLYNQSTSGTKVTLWATGTGTLTPALTLTAPGADTVLTKLDATVFSGSVADHLYGVLTVGSSRHEFPCSFVDTIVHSSDGVFATPVYAINSAHLDTIVNRTIIRDTQPPDLRLLSPASGTATDSAVVTLRIGWTDLTRTVASVDDSVIGAAAADTLNVAYPLDLGPNGIVLKATDALGNADTLKAFIYRRPAEDLNPPDTSVTALHVTPVSATEATPFLSSVAFLYTGSGAVQTGLETNALVPGSEAVVRGVVYARDFGGLPNVQVSVLGQSALGSTLTRADGSFSLVVNGGAPLTLRFKKSGFLSAQRTVTPMVQDYTGLDSLAMIGASSRPLYISTVASDSLSVASRPESDGNGGRRIALIFNPGTRCLVTRANTTHDTTSFQHFHVRFKEYTVGGEGPNTMPGTLPPSSAYTYCIDLKVDEAEAFANGDNTPPDVRLDQPAIAYVKEFLSLPVGTRIPSGYYDEALGAWVPAENGVVLRITDITGGLAQFDVTGDGLPDTTALAPFGISDDERREVARYFAKGDSLWRMPLQHFCPLDFNMLMSALSQWFGRLGALLKNGWKWLQSEITCGCEIENQNRVLGESIPIQGTPFTLDYRSNRQPGDREMRTLRIPLLGEEIPQDLFRIRLRFDVAGHRYSHDISSTDFHANLIYTFDDWDGTDAFHRTVHGSVTATVYVGFEYMPKWTTSSGPADGGSGGQSFGDPGDIPHSGGTAPSGERASLGYVAWSTERVSIGAPDMASAGLAGWTISPHHYFDPNGDGTLWMGDGGVRSTYLQFPVIHAFAGNYASYCSDAVSPVTSIPMVAWGMTVAPDGSVLVADGQHHNIVRIKDGQRTLVAGKLNCAQASGFSPSDEGAIATTVPLNHPTGIAVGADGTIYFADAALWRVFKVTTAGKIYTVAGNSTQRPSNATDQPDALATDWSLSEPVAVAVGPDGSVFVGDQGDHRVLRVTPGGRVRVYAGKKHPTEGHGGNGKATEVPFGAISSLAADRSGNLYVGDYSYGTVSRVSPDGTSTIVGQNDAGNPANFRVTSLALGADQRLVIGLSGGPSAVVGVDRMEADGTFTNVAGGWAGLWDIRDGDFARSARFYSILSVAVDANGDIYIGDVNGAGGKIWRVTSRQIDATEADLVIPSEDAREQYVFTPTGRHLRTEDAVTGVVKYSFEYDAGGRLSRILDVNGDTTRVERTDGVAVRIVAPYGQATTLTIAGDSLMAVANAAGNTYSMSYFPGRLLESLRNPLENTWRYYFYDNGRLHETHEPAGGSNTLEPAESDTMLTVERTTAERRRTTYQVQQFISGLVRRLVQRPERPTGVVGAEVDSMSTNESARGEVVLQRGEDGQVTVGRPVNDTRYGWLAPFPASHTLTLPVSTTTRTAAMDRIWNNSGHVLQEFVTLNQTRSYERRYDSSSRTWTQVSPLSRTGTVTLDAAGRPLRVATANSSLAPVALHYDGRGRLDQLAQDARMWGLGYDAAGRLASVQDVLGNTTTHLYDAADRETLLTLPGTREVRLRWNAGGQLLGITPPGRAEHQFSYTDAGLVESYTPPTVAGVSDPATRYEYNLDRQLTHVVRPDGGEITLHYGDATGRLEWLESPHGTTSFAYSSNTGQLASASSPDSVTNSYAHDGPLLLRESWSGKVVGSVAQTVNSNFQVATQTVVAGSDSSTVTYGYDNDGLLTSATIGSVTETLTRRPADGLISGTTVGGLTNHLTSELSYDERGALWDLKYKFDNAVIFSQRMGRDSLGRIVSLVEGGFGTHTYGYHYDAAGRLDQVTTDGDVTQSLAYDGIGNRTMFGSTSPTDSAVYDAQDRLTRYGDSYFAYTAAGELSRRISPTAAGSGAQGGIVLADTTLYTYDALGSLTTVHLPGGDSVTYAIDAQNRRVARMLNGARTRSWLYERGIFPVAELDGEGALVDRYVYASLAHVPDLLVRDGATYRLITDQLGSVRAVVDVATGTVVQHIDYDAWGVRTLDTAPGWQSLGFAGGLTDTATQLVRFGLRDYDPTVGRWSARDRLGPRSGMGAYVYASLDPLNRTDPSGLLPDGYEGPTPDYAGDIVKAARKFMADEREQARELYRGDEDGENRYRHQDASAKVAQALGPDAALAAGVGVELYEIYDLYSKHKPIGEGHLEDTMTDLLNDLIGIYWGPPAPPPPCPVRK